MGPCGDRPGAPPQNTFDLTPSAQLFLHNANTRKILLFPPPRTCTNMEKNLTPTCKCSLAGLPNRSTEQLNLIVAEQPVPQASVLNDREAQNDTHPIIPRPLAQLGGDADGGFASWRRRSDEVVRYLNGEGPRVRQQVSFRFCFLIVVCCSSVPICASSICQLSIVEREKWQIK